MGVKKIHLHTFCCLFKIVYIKHCYFNICYKSNRKYSTLYNYIKHFILVFREASRNLIWTICRKWEVCFSMWLEGCPFSIKFKDNISIKFEIFWQFNSYIHYSHKDLHVTLYLNFKYFKFIIKQLQETSKECIKNK